MTSLHSRLLAELSRIDPHRLTRLGRVAWAVVELHAPGYVDGEPDGDPPWWCEACDQAQPCSTIRAIATALDVPLEETSG